MQDHTQCPEGGPVLLEEAAFRSSLQSEARGKDALKGVWWEAAPHRKFWRQSFFGRTQADDAEDDDAAADDTEDDEADEEQDDEAG